ncbi:MAG: hypothetical protein QG612_1762, partial [Pseudomonadota bacterium]|nr:hypothetical protein [Pseudomonadota bacterium]
LPTLLSRPVAQPRAAETASAGEIDAPR